MRHLGTALRILLAAVIAICSLVGPALPMRSSAEGAQPDAAPSISVLTQHNDVERSGANPQETTLSPSTVNATSFGKLFTRAVDGSLYAQPLYVPNLTIAGKGTHNVVFAATMHNTVYAFDADDPTQSAPLWSINLGPSITLPNTCIAAPGYTDISTESGILGTPVIDPASNTLFVVASTVESTGTPNCNGQYFSHRLHALDITTGQERAGSPVTINASVPGTGPGSSGGVDTFTSYKQLQRTGLLLANGDVYIGFGSYGDYAPYWGWVLAYGAQSGSPNFLKQTAVFNVAPNGWDGAIWQAGAGLTADSSGNIYLSTANGLWDAGTGGTSYGDTVLKLSPSLQVLDWFTPYNQDVLDKQDVDLGSAGVLLLPGTTRLVTGGKQGKLYLLDTNNMGHYHADSDSQIPQSFQATVGHIHGSPIYWNGPNGPTVYVWGEWDHLQAYNYANGQFNTTPSSSSSMPVAPGMPGGMLSVSANGSTLGSGIVWAALPMADANQQVVPGMLRAFEASDLSHELWDSQQNPGRDSVGNFGKFAPPTIANGKVYVSTFSNQLDVYGLLNGAGPTATPTATAGSGAGDPLAGLRNTRGISDDGDPGAANLDGLGFSYSYQALRVAGVSPGGAVSAGGLAYAWPAASPGAVDDVSALGQTFAYGPPGSPATLGFLGASVNGDSAGAGTITYADGSTQPYTLAFSDWYDSPPAAGNIVAAALAYRNAPWGRDNRPFSLFAATVALAPGKSLRSVTLPNAPSLHIFSVAAGNAPAPTATSTAGQGVGDPLAGLRNTKGISDDGDPGAANLDGLGFSYSYQALTAAGVAPGGAVSAGGLAYAWPAASPGAVDDVSALGQTFAYGPPGSPAALGFLGTSVNGDHAGAGTITYADGTTQPYTLALSDWYDSPPGVGNVVAAALAYRNAPWGRDNRPFSLFAATVALAPGKSLRSVTLPNAPALHIFSVAAGNAPITAHAVNPADAATEPETGAGGGLTGTPTSEIVVATATIGDSATFTPIATITPPPGQ